MVSLAQREKRAQEIFQKYFEESSEYYLYVDNFDVEVGKFKPNLNASDRSFNLVLGPQKEGTRESSEGHLLRSARTALGDSFHAMLGWLQEVQVLPRDRRLYVPGTLVEYLTIPYIASSEEEIETRKGRGKYIAQKVTGCKSGICY